MGNVEGENIMIQTDRKCDQGDKGKTIQELIEKGYTFLGIEFGSTRIKAILTDSKGMPLASGDHAWENRYENHLWTYSLEDILEGMQECYARLAAEVKEKYNVTLETVKGMGFSAMMHGYMVFDKEGSLLVPFRTWRNSNTARASKELTEYLNFHIPERWSIAHLYQAILDGEEHVKDIAYITTLAGFIHWKLTGEKVIGIGDASGMFPVDSDIKDFDAEMIEKFDHLIAYRGFSWKLKDILPKVLCAGESAGSLTKEGAGILDKTGSLQADIPLCPPEGDAGTGMTATNSVMERTGNVSAGTSVFAMIVLERGLKKLHPEIDMVTTPSGVPVAMVHANNCTSDLNAWAGLFKEFVESCGFSVDTNLLYETLFRSALKGDRDCGGLLSYGYLSGENITDCEEGRPLFVRMPDSRFNLSNFVRAHLFSALGALKIGMDILLKEEGVTIDVIFGHGGFFKTAGVGQRIMAGAMNVPVTVMETAGEGGAWGMSLLASYMVQKGSGETLGEYLEERIFKGQQGLSLVPDTETVSGFEIFIQRYKDGLKMERVAIKSMK